jgi:hypothetical protein
MLIDANCPLVSAEINIEMNVFFTIIVIMHSLHVVDS